MFIVLRQSELDNVGVGMCSGATMSQHHNGGGGVLQLITETIIKRLIRQVDTQHGYTGPKDVICPRQDSVG